MVVATPLAILTGGAAFVPWRAPYWKTTYLTANLRRHRWILLGVVLTLGFDIIIQYLDPLTTQLVGRDFTPFFSTVDGDFHARLQAALPWDWFRTFFGVVYVVGFPFLVNFTPLLFVWLDQPRHALRSLLAYVYCMGLGFPFYLFFPVREVWSVDPPKAENLATFAPKVEEHLYAFNEVNNGFPSLHTAITIAVAYAVWTSGHRTYRWFAATLCGLIVFSTVYDGIHWTLDVVGGLLLALVVIWLVDHTVPLTPPRDSGRSVQARPDSIENG